MGVNEQGRATAARGRTLRLGTLARTGGLPILDQGIISLGNFLTTVIMARTLDPAQFGLVVLAYAALYAFNAVQGSLLVGPHGVLSAGRTRKGYIDYTTSVGVGQIVMACGVLAVSLLAGLVFGSPETELVFMAVGLAGLAWQLQEFARRVLYVEDRVGSAVANDIINYGGQFAVVALILAAGHLDGAASILGIGLTSAVAACLGLVQIRRSLTGQLHIEYLRENFTYGKWLLGGEIAQVLSTRLYTFLAAAILGTAAAGVVGALILTVNPLNLVIFSLATVVPIRLARVRAEQGSEAAHRLLMRLHVITTPPVIVICLGLALFAEPLLSLLYGGRYDGYGSLVAVLALFTLVRYHSTLVGNGLWIFYLTKGIFIGHVVAAVITLPTGYLLVTALGLMGVPVGMLVSALAFTAVWWWYYLRGRRQALSASTGGAATGAPPVVGAPGFVDGDPRSDVGSAHVPRHKVQR